jgi:hypothetical protein
MALTVNNFHTRKMPAITVSLTPSPLAYAEIRREYLARTGTENTYEHNEVWSELVKRRRVDLVLENVSFEEAQAFAEPIRIAHPDQHVNIYDGNGNWIGNTTWNDQMQMFWEYPVFTEYGNFLRDNRIAEATALGIIASWE